LSIEVATLVSPVDNGALTVVPNPGFTAVLASFTTTIATKLKVNGKNALHQLIATCTCDTIPPTGTFPVPVTINPSVLTKLKVSTLSVLGVGDFGSVPQCTVTITGSGQVPANKLKTV